MELIEINKIINEMQADFDAIAMPRSAYVLENLVVKVHEHETIQWLHCVLEMRIKYNNIRRSQLQREIIREEINRLDLNDTIEQLKADLKRIDLEELEHSELGYIREFMSLYQIYQTLPRFTREQIEEAQAEYWFSRLVKQSVQDIQATGRVSVGNIEALRQIKAKVEVTQAGEIVAHRVNGELDVGT